MSGGALDDASLASPTLTRPQVSSDSDFTVDLTITVRGTGTNAKDGTSDTASATQRTFRVTDTPPPPPVLAAPNFADDTGDPVTWTKDEAITAIVVPAATGNPTPTYAAVGTLPAGITFDPATLEVEGTPTAVGTGTITIRATNSQGTDDWTLRWTVEEAQVNTATQTIGNPGTSFSVFLRWEGVSVAIPAAFFEDGNPGTLEEIQLLSSSRRASFRVVGTRDLTTRWEKFNPALIIQAGTVRLELPGPDNDTVGSRDATEPYTWSLAAGDNRIANFITAFRALPESTRNATTFTLQDGVPPALDGKADLGKLTARGLLDLRGVADLGSLRTRATAVTATIDLGRLDVRGRVALQGRANLGRLDAKGSSELGKADLGRLNARGKIEDLKGRASLGRLSADGNTVLHGEAPLGKLRTRATSVTARISLGRLSARGETVLRGRAALGRLDARADIRLEGLARLGRLGGQFNSIRGYAHLGRLIAREDATARINELRFSRLDAEGVSRTGQLGSLTLRSHPKIIGLRREVEDVVHVAGYETTAAVRYEADTDCFVFPVRRNRQYDRGMFEFPATDEEADIRLLLPDLRVDNPLGNDENRALGLFWVAVSALVAGQIEMTADNEDWPPLAVIEANNATPGENQPGDTVILFRGSISKARSWDPVREKWVVIEAFLTGDLLVTGAIISRHVAAQQILASHVLMGPGLRADGDKVALQVLGNSLTLNAMGLAVNVASSSLAVTASGIALKLAGTDVRGSLELTASGLRVVVDDFEVTVADNTLRLTSAGLAVNIGTNAGLGLVAGGLGVVVGSNTGLSLTSTGLTVDIAASSGLELTATGLKVDIASSSGLELTATGLKVDIGASSGLELTSTGLFVNVAASSGLQLTSRGLTVVVGTSSGLEITATGISLRVADTSLVVGATGVAVGDLRSTNFVSGATGWQMLKDGTFELNGGVFRGNLESDNYDGVIDPGTGAITTKGTRGWYLGRNGNADFQAILANVRNWEGLWKGSQVVRQVQWTVPGTAGTVTAPYTAIAVLVAFVLDNLDDGATPIYEWLAFTTTIPTKQASYLAIAGRSVDHHGLFADIDALGIKLTSISGGVRVHSVWGVRNPEADSGSGGGPLNPDDPIPAAVAPSVTISAVGSVAEGASQTFTATVAGGTYDRLTYSWSVTRGGGRITTNARSVTYTAPQVSRDTAGEVTCIVHAAGEGTNAINGTFAQATDKEAFTITDSASPPPAPTITTDTDTIRIRATSRPSKPTGGTGSATHLPTGWTRGALSPTTTQGVYSSQRTRTYSNGVFTSATAWGDVDEEAPATGTAPIPTPGTPRIASRTSTSTTVIATECLPEDPSIDSRSLEFQYGYTNPPSAGTVTDNTPERTPGSSGWSTCWGASIPDPDKSRTIYVRVRFPGGSYGPVFSVAPP